MIIYRRINKNLEQNKYIQKNCLNQDSHHHHYQYDFHHKKLLLRKKKHLTPKKLLTRLPILLVQIKVRNNSYKLKNKFKQMLYLLYQHNKIAKKVYSDLIKLL